MATGKGSDFKIYDEYVHTRINELLAQNGDAFGAAGLPYGVMRFDPSGRAVPADTTCRIWVVTEWLRACLVEPGSGVGSAGSAIAGLQRFLDVPVKGLWYERCDAETGRFVVENVPASSLYHIVSALAPIMTMPDSP